MKRQLAHEWQSLIPQGPQEKPGLSQEKPHKVQLLGGPCFVARARQPRASIQPGHQCIIPARKEQQEEKLNMSQQCTLMANKGNHRLHYVRTVSRREELSYPSTQCFCCCIWKTLCLSVPRALSLHPEQRRI